MLLFLNVIYVLIAASMIVLILMQRGSGAQAGAGFGGGASATVFGARGASSFLSKATKWLAISFFVIAMFMAWQATHLAVGPTTAGQGLGVMSQVPVDPASSAPAVPEAAPAQPTAPAVAPDVPAAPAAPEATDSAPSDPVKN
ncbi:preprotein translocase subunit SecG [Lysobacter ciconiae]|uniref:Protein-export membrane protein SecG n=1 Tax=Novilysobacter ciconiae TaxID=2781022 RepID=A0A7S6UEE1_9GAMM|nr:preprotein translocase subunit SecG [Lysobacter ciconiae]QOW18731.1 preprotein translocase subunit SecG [Lysobacter ciconiae]